MAAMLFFSFHLSKYSIKNYSTFYSAANERLEYENQRRAPRSPVWSASNEDVITFQN